MKRRLAIVAVTLACSQAWGLGVETGNTDTVTKSIEQGRDDSNKASKSVGGIVMLNSVRAAGAPIDKKWLKDNWYYGGLRKPLSKQVEALLGVDPVFYAERRIAMLSASGDDVAQFVSSLYRDCGKDEACIATVVEQEVIARIAQSPGYQQSIITLETQQLGAAPDGYVDIQDKDWTNYSSSAVIATYAANVIDRYLTESIPASQSMSLKQRRLALGKLQFTLPAEVRKAAFPAATWKISWGLWKRPGPLEFQVEGFGNFRVDDNGVTVSQGGAPVYGNGDVIASKKVDYTDESIGNVKSSTARSKAGTTSTKKITIQ